MFEGEADKFDPLDEVLGAARWPEVSREAQGRLRAGWAEAWRRERFREEAHSVGGGWAWRRGLAWGMAAAVVLGVGVWVGVTTRPGVRVEVAEAVKVEERVSFGREARLVELVVARTAVRERRGGEQRAAERPAAFVDVAGSLRAIVERRGAVAALRALAAEPERGRVVEELIARLSAPKVEVRWAAARALGYLDGPEVTERLARMVEGNRNRREALAALVQSGGEAAREYVRRARGDEELAGVVRAVEVQVRSLDG